MAAAESLLWLLFTPKPFSSVFHSNKSQFPFRALLSRKTNLEMQILKTHKKSHNRIKSAHSPFLPSGEGGNSMKLCKIQLKTFEEFD